MFDAAVEDVSGAGTQPAGTLDMFTQQGLRGLEVVADAAGLLTAVAPGEHVGHRGGQPLADQLEDTGLAQAAGTEQARGQAAGIAALTYMEQNDVCNRAESLCAILTGGLEKAAAKAGVPVQIHRLGSMFTVFFSDKPVTDFDSAAASDLEAFKIYFHSMLEQGIYLPPSQFETNFVSVAHSPEDLQKTIDAAEVAFAEVAKARK